MRFRRLFIFLYNVIVECRLRDVSVERTHGNTRDQTVAERCTILWVFNDTSSSLLHAFILDASFLISSTVFAQLGVIKKKFVRYVLL